MATTAHTSAPGGSGEHKGAFPPFDASTFASQLVWLAITFVVLYVTMSRLALPRVRSIIDAREQRIAGDMAEAEKLKAQSDEAIASYEKALAEARSRAQAIANETAEKQKAEADASRKTLESQLNAKLADAEKTIAATKTAAMSNVQSIATDAAKAIVEQLLGKTPDEKDVAAAVSSALKR